MKNITKHHIIPSSRGGTLEKGNVARLDDKEHDLYHQLFSNKTPVEILDYLSNHFWFARNGENGDRFIRQYLDKFFKS